MLIFTMLNTKQSIREYLQGKTIPIWLDLGSIPLHWKQRQVRDFLEEYGKIDYVKMRIKYGRFSGVASILFRSMTCADYAIAKVNMQWNQEYRNVFTLKWLDTEQNRLGISPAGEHKLFIGSLPRQANQEDLYDVFSQIGQVQGIRLQQKQFWAFVDFKYRQSALLAIRFCHGQVYFHGSHIPIEVRFKQRKYNSFMTKKHEKEPLDPFQISDVPVDYYQHAQGAKTLYENYKTKEVSSQRPPVGSIIRRRDTSIYQIKSDVDEALDPALTSKKSGPVGANLFLFHLPNDAKQPEIYNLFVRFGRIVSVRVMKQKSGKSKGIGFVSFERVDAANDAIDEMNGYDLRGKRLKVELNKKDGEILGKASTHLQTNFQFDS